MAFSRLRDWSASVCTRPAARPVLYAISFAESVFFPVPTDVALAPIVGRQPQRWLSIVFWCVVYSVVGALAAYILAMFFWEGIFSTWLPAEMLAQIEEISAQLNDEGFVLVLFSAITPIPFKLCALAAGITAMSLPVFISAALLGRALRYGAVGYLVFRFRDQWRQLLHSHIEPAGWGLLVLLALYLLFQYA